MCTLLLAHASIEYMMASGDQLKTIASKEHSTLHNQRSTIHRFSPHFWLLTNNNKSNPCGLWDYILEFLLHNYGISSNRYSIFLNLCIAMKHKGSADATWLHLIKCAALKLWSHLRSLSECLIAWRFCVMQRFLKTTVWYAAACAIDQLLDVITLVDYCCTTGRLCPPQRRHGSQHCVFNWYLQHSKSANF